MIVTLSRNKYKRYRTLGGTLAINQLQNLLMNNDFKSNIISSNIEKKIFVLFVVLFFLSDFLTKVSLVYFDSSFLRFAGIIKLGFEFIMLFFLIKEFKFNTALILGLILILAFFVSNFIKSEPINHDQLLKNAYYANRFLYIFIFIGFLKLYDVHFSGNDEFIKLFKTVLYMNAILIIVAFIFEIELFRSYFSSSRFGYDGIFSKHGEAAYYYIFLISILYFEYIKNKSRKNLLILISISLVVILLGKKNILLFLFLLFLAHIIFVLKKGKALGLLLIIFIPIILLLKEALLNGLFILSPYWENQYKSHGFMGMITSLRSNQLVDFINYIQSNWNVLNYFVGAGEYDEYIVEFEFVDVFMFFGLIGIIIFICLFKRYFYNKSNKISRLLLFCILMTSFFSGALFLSVTGMMFFNVIFQWINNTEFTDLEKKKISL